MNERKGMWIVMFFGVIAAVPLEYRKSITKSIVDTNKDLHLFQGDLVFTKEQKEKPMKNKGKGIQSAVQKNKDLKWQNNIVPYTISSKFSEEEKEKYIRKGMKQIEAVTCIRFKEYRKTPKDTSYIKIIDGSGCWSFVGRAHMEPGKTQELSLNRNGCLYVGTVIHELLHALGIFHEQSRPDRDKYVKIFPENMYKGTEENFEIRDDTYDHKSPYDPDSIMHYENTAYSKNNKPTILWKNNPDRKLGGEVLTKEDIYQINVFYDCLDPKKTDLPPTTTEAPSTSTPLTTYESTSPTDITCVGGHTTSTDVTTEVTTEETTYHTSTMAPYETTSEMDSVWTTLDPTDYEDETSTDDIDDIDDIDNIDDLTDESFEFWED